MDSDEQRDFWADLALIASVLIADGLVRKFCFGRVGIPALLFPQSGAESNHSAGPKNRSTP